MENQIPEHVKAERLTILQNELAKSQQKFNDNSLGKNFEILLDREGKLANQLVGKSPYMQAVRLNDVKDTKLGDIVNVKIVGSAPNSLVGELAGNK